LVAPETAATAKTAGAAGATCATVRVKRITVGGVINPALDEDAPAISAVSAPAAVAAPPTVSAASAHQSKLAIIAVTPLATLGAVAAITTVASATATTAMGMKLHCAVYDVGFKVNRAATSARAAVRAAHAVGSITAAVPVLRAVVIDPVAVRSPCLRGLRGGPGLRRLWRDIDKVGAVDLNVCNAHVWTLLVNSSARPGTKIWLASELGPDSMLQRTFTDPLLNFSRPSLPMVMLRA
jgi:hypothetical protein